MGNKISYCYHSYHVNNKKLGLIQDEFIPYKQSMELKALGYDIPCFGSYSDENTFNFTTGGLMYKTTPSEKSFCIAPLYQQAFLWLSRTQNIKVEVPNTPTEKYSNWLEILDKLIQHAKTNQKITM